MIIATLFYIAYLAMDARQDALYIRKYGYIFHSWNWALRASAAMGIGYAHYQDWVKMGAYCLLLIPVTWIVFDLLINLFLGKNPFTYMGTGHWDDVFRWVFDKNFRRKNGTYISDSPKPVMGMWIVKLTFLAIAIGVFLHYTH